MVDGFDVAVTFADAGKVSLELRCEDADGWLVEEGCVVMLGAGMFGKLGAGDFVSERLVETAAGGLDSIGQNFLQKSLTAWPCR